MDHDIFVALLFDQDELASPSSATAGFSPPGLLTPELGVGKGVELGPAASLLSEQALSAKGIKERSRNSFERPTPPPH